MLWPWAPRVTCLDRSAVSFSWAVTLAISSLIHSREFNDPAAALGGIGIGMCISVADTLLAWGIAAAFRNSGEHRSLNVGGGNKVRYVEVVTDHPNTYHR